jgi:glycosyltransferase involved in cell wall biosynthesis
MAVAEGGPSADDDEARPGALHGVLVTYRRPVEVAEMLRRLDDQVRRLDTLVVVDNDPAASARAAVEAFAARRRVGTGPRRGAAPRVSYVATGGNAGPAGGIARGMRAVLEHAADDDWIVSLDDDDPPASADVFARLEALGRGLRARGENVGGVGMAGGRFSPGRAQAVHVPDAELVGAVPCDWIGGNQFPCYAVRALRQVGVFDERLFFGFDDLDFGLRLAAGGWSLFAEGGLWRGARGRAGRLGGAPQPSRLVDPPSWRRYYSTRNMTYILWQGGHRAGVARLAARALAKPLVNLPRRPTVAARHLAVDARAIADALRDRMGLTVEPG